MLCATCVHMIIYLITDDIVQLVSAKLSLDWRSCADVMENSCAPACVLGVDRVPLGYSSMSGARELFLDSRLA
jgi:hypothetical protein